MNRVLRRAPFAALCAAALVAACAKGDKTADSTKMSDSAMAAMPGTNTATSTSPAPAPATLTDPNIVAILDAANVADSAAGSIAATKGTAADVKAFGKTMMRDHHALRKAGQDLAKKLNVTPAMPAGDNSEATAKAWQDSLTAMAKGADFDKAYISHEVAYHQQVLQTAQTALGAAQNAELKALITKAAPNIQAHLTHAQSIQSKLGGTASTGGAAGGTPAAGTPKP